MSRKANVKKVIKLSIVITSFVMLASSTALAGRFEGYISMIRGETIDGVDYLEVYPDLTDPVQWDGWATCNIGQRWVIKKSDKAKAVLAITAFATGKKVKIDAYETCDYPPGQTGYQTPWSLAVVE